MIKIEKREETIESLRNDTTRMQEQATLRDRFAMAAMTGSALSFPYRPIHVAEAAYLYADAMMEARVK